MVSNKTLFLTICPCGSHETYVDCCERYHQREDAPATAEQLMRSRYSAYALQLADYLVATTHPEKRTTDLKYSILEWAAQVEFTALEIVATHRGQPTDKIGKVEFIAHYRQQQQAGQLHEISRFRRYKSAWLYYDGEIY